MRIVIFLMTLVSVSCAVSPPKGQFCSHYQPLHIAICNDLETGNDLPDIPIDQTDHWIMLSPDTWKSIMDYIDALKRKAGARVEGKKETTVTVQDIENFKLWLQQRYNKNQSRLP